MLVRTHLAFAVFFALLVSQTIVPTNQGLFIIAAVLASFIPDLDHPNSSANNTLKVTKVVSFFFKHRGLFHSLLLGVVLGMAGWYLRSLELGTAVFAGFLSHLIMDAITLEGVNFLYPVSRLHIAGPIRTGSWTETLVFLAVIVGIVWMVV